GRRTGCRSACHQRGRGAVERPPPTPGCGRRGHRPAPGRQVRLSGHGYHRSKHRRQDRLAQDARPARAHAPGGTAGAGRGGCTSAVFTRVMADIGDEQSIAQSLSTFSSHLVNVVRFVEAAAPGTLVLLDEVGAGTDPTEGSALAMAIVERLLAAGAVVAATTHYAELKTFATE